MTPKTTRTKAPAVLLLIAAWQTCLASAQTSTCSVSITGTSAGEVQAASIACSGNPVQMSGAEALQQFSAQFTSGVNFSVDPAAESLLSVSGQQVNFDTLVLANLNLQQLSVLNVSDGMYNFTKSSVNGNMVSGTAFVIVASSSTVNVISSTFSNNTGANFGGALALDGGSLNVQNSTFSGNSAQISGGAVAVNGSTSTSLSLSASQFTGNTAGCKGGQVYVSVFNAGTISNCTFDQGAQTVVSGGGAGGICASEARYTSAGSSACYVEQYTSVTVTASTFSANTGVGAGGVLGTFTGLTTSVIGCNFTANSSPSGIGSALFVVQQNLLSVVNNTFAGNGASTYGAVYATAVPSVLVQGNSFTANEVAPAAAGGGGATSGGAVCLVSSCDQLCSVAQNIFTDNSVLGSGANGGALYADTPGNLTVTDNKFLSNTAASAGGALTVFSNGQTTSPTALSVNGNTFTNNTVTVPQTGVGGAISLNNIISLNMTENSFTDNTAAQGGALFVVGTSTSSLGLQSSSFVNNTASSDSGGAVYVYTLQELTVDNVTFTGNSARNQGGAFQTNIIPTIAITDSVFDSNTAQLSGGGWLHITSSNVVLENSVFTNNIASVAIGGGAVLSAWGTATITNVTFTGNQALGTSGTAGQTSSAPQAGGLGFVSGTAASINACHFSSNSAAANGGSLYAFGVGSNLNIQNSTFMDSEAGLAGGAVRVSGSANVNMTASTISSSSARGVGGGGAMSAYNMTGIMSLAGDTFSNNSATTQGGILAVTDSPSFAITITNSTVTDNTAPEGSTVYADSGSNITSTVAAIGNSSVACNYCLFQGPGATSFANLTSSGGRALSPGTSSGGSGGSSLSGGAIAGIIVGALAGVALVALLAWLLLRRRKDIAAKKDVEMAKPEKPQVTSAKNRLPPVKSAFSEAGTGSFWSEQRGTNGHSDRSANLENLNSDDMIAGNSITGSIGASTTVNSRKPLLDTNTGVTYVSDTMSNITDNTNTPFPDVPWSDWQIDARDIQIVQRPNGKDWLLGGGAFGQVYKAMLKGVIPVAVKVLKDQSYTSREEFQREVGLLKSLHNSNIVQFQGACLEEDKMLLITEFMDGGDLHKAISRRQISWEKRGKHVAIDILRGLHFLHAKRIVHMDLKSPNILLTRHGQAKLADVGLAKVIRDRNYITQVSVIGTFAWAAPEVLTNERCTEKADIYSLGIILWEIVTGEAPVRGGRRDVRVPDECPQEVADLIDSCLRTDPTARPSATEALDVLMLEHDDGPAPAAA